MRIRVSLVGTAVVAAWLGMAGVGEARNLRNTLGAPVEGRGGILEAALGPLGSVISSQIANQIPTLSTSAGFTYEYNAQLEVYERSTKTFGPLFSERAVTIGKGKFNVNLSYTYIDFDNINGHDLDSLTARVEGANFANGDAGFAGIFEPDLASNYPGLASNQIFTEVNVNLDLEAQLIDFSFTYGVLDNLDVNIDVPLLRTFARSTVSELTLDPRFEELISPTLHGPDITAEHSASEDAIGIGDIRLRSKYLALDGPLRLAGLLDLILPTGSPGNFQGTGDTRLGTYLIASGTLFEIFEPHMQAGRGVQLQRRRHQPGEVPGGRDRSGLELRGDDGRLHRTERVRTARTHPERGAPARGQQRGVHRDHGAVPRPSDPGEHQSQRHSRPGDRRQGLARPAARVLRDRDGSSERGRSARRRRPDGRSRSDVLGPAVQRR